MPSNPYKYYWLLSDANGHPQVLRFYTAGHHWSKYVPEFGGGSWSTQVDWPEQGHEVMIPLSPATERKWEERQKEEWTK